MCSRPIEQEGKTFACRSCNDCIANRKHNWIARAMAEKLEWPHTICIALTYDPKQSQANRDAREFFVYDDVRLFVKRLASACRRYAKKHKLNIPSPRVKFLAAGEQGSKGDMHCHWHMILYSDVDLMKIGEFQGMKDGRKVVLTDPADLLTSGNTKKRLDWTLWGKGFVTLQQPDQGGVAYVVSYVLKDQFTSEKSRDTMREAQAENFATGLFRMSKLPPIGETWLVRKMEALEASGSVLPNLNIKIPGMSGYWHPSGSFREKLLWFLVALNRRAVWATGANAPQWSSLLHSCKDLQSDLDILNGPQKENPDDSESFEHIIHKASRQNAYYHYLANPRPVAEPCTCADCLGLASASQLEKLGLVRIRSGGEASYRVVEGDFATKEFEPAAVCDHDPA